MIRIIAIASLLFYSTVLFAQVKVTGKVMNAKNNPVELAEILIIDKNAVARKNDITDGSGNFTLYTESGSYLLQIKKMGEILWEQKIDISHDINLGNIEVFEKEEKLSEVVINAKKKIIERKVDRLIFNVENSIAGSTGDAMDALKVTPNIRVQNETIALVGKSNLQIMVDDILIQLSETDMINYLKSIPANDIKSIEVITAPSAKYESSGNSGIINIKLKKVKKDSWNASLNSAYIQKTYATGTLGGSFNYKKDKLSLYNSVNYRNGTRLSTDNSSIYYTEETWNQNNPRKINDEVLSDRFGLDYEFSKKWTLGLQYITSYTKSNNNEMPLTTITDNDNQEINYYISSKSKYITKPKLNSINWHNLFTIDSIGKKVSIDINYLESVNKSNRDYFGNELDINSQILPDTYFAAINSNNQNIKNFSGKIDFEIPTKFINLEFGGKLSTSTTNNNAVFYNNETGDPTLDLGQTNTFKYKEKIQALYISGNKKIGSKWESQIGLRLETTQTEGFSLNLNQTNKKNYAKLFPTFYLTYNANENNTFSFNYTRRIVRPNYQQLNPFRIYSSPYVYAEGNPYLQPSFTDNFDFTYSYKKLESNIYVTSVKNNFQQIGIVDSNSNITRYFIENFLSSQNYGISESYTFDRIKWWNSILTFNANYFQSKSKLIITEQNNDGFNAFVSTNNDFTLNKPKTFLFNLTYWYNFPGAFGIYKNTASSSLSMSAKYLMLNKDLQLSIIGNDIFSSQRPTYISYVNNIRQEYRNYYDARSLTVSLLYKFGNNKINVNQRKFGNEEEKNRAN